MSSGRGISRRVAQQKYAINRFVSDSYCPKTQEIKNSNQAKDETIISNGFLIFPMRLN